MIGKVGTGKSFAKCIAYCLEDKRELSEEQKEQLSISDGLRHKNRAEVLEYNQCFGNKKELANQFLDVRKLRPGIEKPVFHITLRPASGDQLSKEQFIQIGQAAAREFGLANNQYICVLHTDTPQPHIHLVGNRIGFDGKLASDRHSYRRIAELCRRVEKQFGLKQVANPRRFQSPQERQAPRLDQRKMAVKRAIQDALKDSSSYADFERKMKDKGYQVIKGRGIAFFDSKKVRIKGSEVGFSLQNIQRIIEAIRVNQIWSSPNLTPEEINRVHDERERALQALRQTFFKGLGIDPNGSQVRHLHLGLQNILYILLRPEQQGQELPWELRQDQRKDQRRKRALHR